MCLHVIAEVNKEIYKATRDVLSPDCQAHDSLGTRPVFYLHITKILRTKISQSTVYENMLMHLCPVYEAWYKGIGDPVAPQLVAPDSSMHSGAREAPGGESELCM